MKNCSETHQCVTASANFGITKIVINNQCCKTNLCNTQTEPGTFNTGGRILLCDNKIQIIYISHDLHWSTAYFVDLTMHVS